jgi:dolichol-phosphate mannosyltransferase
MSMKLSIIIPVFNERETLLQILKAINKVVIPKIEKEIIIIDDFSTDGTKTILHGLKNKYKIYYHRQNRGKGAAIKTALKYITGDIVIIQDADLEYDPQDYIKLIKPIIKGEAKVVYGTRAKIKSNRPSSRLFYWGGWLICHLTNLLYGTKLTDVNCCYKLFTKEVISKIKLEGNRFEFCEEVTAKILNQKYEIKEVSVCYRPRSMDEGKKIRLTDGITAIKTLIKYRFYG